MLFRSGHIADAGGDEPDGVEFPPQMVPCPSFAEKLRVLEREDKHTLPFGSGELHHRPHLEDPGKLLRLNPYSGCPADNGDVRARAADDPVAGAGIGIVDSPYREGPRPELRKPSLGVLESG